MKKIEKLAFASNQNLKERDYWLNKLDGDLFKSVFPYDNNLQYLNNEETTKEVVQFSMPEELSSSLNKICGSQDVKLHVILVAGVAALLEKYCGNEDIIVGIPIYKQEIEADFINTVLALKNRVSSNMTFKELILQVHKSIFEAIENQNYPIETLLYLLDMTHTVNSFPLFDTAILLNNIHDERYIQNIQLNLIFTFLRTEDSIEGAVEFNPMLYQISTIKRIIKHLQQFFRQSLFNVNRQLSHIDILTVEERKQLLFDFNETDARYPNHKTIHQLFAQQVQRTPDSIALGGVGVHLPTDYVLITYKKLNESANCLASQLIKQGVSPDDIIAIMIDRSLEMVTAIMAVLKTGGAYMPIDPDYPEDRVNFMLKDSNVKILLTDNPSRHFNCQLSIVNYQLSMFNEKSTTRRRRNDPPKEANSINNYQLTSNNLQLKANSLAYVIYTSGSTGQPKGVLIQHKHVVRLMVNDKFLFDFNNHDVWTMFHSYCFDFSVWEMYGALLYGGRLVIIPKMIARDPVRYLEILKDEKVTVLNQTPSAFYGLSAEELKFTDKVLCLKYIIFGGEALMPRKLKKWKEKYPETRLINMYGITETTVHVTFKDINDTDIQSNISNIGKPIPTLTVYIMDKNFKLLPLGVGGEICVGGDGVGRGYLNRPELTAEKFGHDLWDYQDYQDKKKKLPGRKNYMSLEGTRGLAPLSKKAPGKNHMTNDRLYKSGDLGKLLVNGDIEYLGRIDQQVKIRGFRIELGEIENQLQKYNGIKETVVTAREDKTGNKHLCAYIVSDREISIPPLKEYLATQLTDYMIPLFFIQLEEIPLTPNGKVDRKKLPAPSGNLIDMDTYTPPKSDMEKKLVEIWKNVLELEQLGVKDNFFNVGGDSIKAIKIVNFINKQLHTNLRIPDLYLNETIEKLTVIIEQNKSSHHDNQLKEILSEIEELKNRIIVKAAEKPGELAGVEIEDIEDLYPMSDIEKGMVYHSVKETEQALYHDQMVHQITYVDFDPQRFKKAMTLMVEKHPILRTSLHIGDFEEEIQIVHKYKENNMEIEHYDISNMEMQDQEVYIKEFILEDSNRPFNTAKLPLWRLKTFALDKNNIVVLWTFHHAIIDGWSDASFKTELNNIYLKLKTEPVFVPQKLKSSYKNFIVEQITYKKKKEIRDYWRDELLDYKRLQLPGTVHKKGKKHRLGRMQTYSMVLEESLLNQLQDIAVKYNTNLKCLCFGAYVFLLNFFSYENDITTGMVTNNRPVCEDGEKILGCFLNTIPVRIMIPSSITWLDYIEIIDKKLAKLTEYGYISLLEIAKITGEEGKGQNPLFDTIFNFLDFFEYQNLQVGQWEDDQKAVQSNKESNKLSLRGQSITNTLFDFTVDTTGRSLGIIASYWDSLFTTDEVKKYCGYFERILNRFIDEPEGLIGKDEIISLEEKQQLLIDFNDTAREYPENKTLPQLFAEQVARTPGNIAEFFPVPGAGSPAQAPDTISEVHPFREGKYLTYRELDETSNQIARYLRQLGIRQRDFVALMVNPSIEMIIAILGILKAGCVYIPLDPKAPEARRKYILEDCQVKLLLTGAELAEENYSGLPGEKPVIEVEMSPQNFAYVIFTSGSTGIPKGVAIRHSNLSPLLHWGYGHLEIGPTDRTLQNLSYYFDWSVWEIFITLTTGAGLYTAPVEILLNPAESIAFIQVHEITVLHATPTQYSYITNVGEPLESLKYLFIGAEKLSCDLLERSFSSVSEDCRVFNMYGPTECTIIASVLEIDRSDDIHHRYDNLSSIPIGVPVGNTSLLVLDKYSSLCPVNVAGELYIAGDGVAPGYLNDPEKTGKSFPKNIYKTGNIKGPRLYKTGDLSRWLPDVTIEFLGRIDHQIKIRGYRIELGEIENQLLKHPDIKEAVVMARDKITADKYLCAYIVIKRKFDSTELRGYLSLFLPDYMIPDYFVFLEKIPLNPNGKVDRKALPKPEPEVEQDRIAPKDPVEERLADLWSEVLGIEKHLIGIDSNFFQLGGHSLKATILIARIHKELDAKLPLAEVFRTPSIRELSAYIKNQEKDKYTTIVPIEKRDYYQLSAAQKRLYILQQMESDNISYNITHIIPLEEYIDRQKLEDTFKKIISRHESLRTSFEIVDQEPVQRIHQEANFSIENLEYDETTAATGEDISENLTRPFDLSKAPLLRVYLLKTSPSRHILFLDIHHIVTDGTSQKILTKDFVALYPREELPLLRLYYKDFSQWQNQQKQQENLVKQEAFWMEKFSGEALPVLNLPMDYQRPSIQSFEGRYVRFVLGERNSQTLRDIAMETGSTLFMSFLSIYTFLLSRLSGQEDIIVGTPVEGRRHADLEGIVGMFVNTLALRNFPIGEKNFAEFLGEVKECTLAAFENQEYQFEDLVEKLSVRRDASRNPVFDVMLNVLNQSQYEGNIPADSEVDNYDHQKGVSKFDMSWVVIDFAEKLLVGIEYSSRLFKSAAIERFIRYFKQILEVLSRVKEIRLSEIEIISKEEKQQILFGFTDTDTCFEYAVETTLHRLFVEQAARTPDSIAVIGQSIQGAVQNQEELAPYAVLHAISYRELDKKSRQLAYLLKEKGVEPDNIAAIMLERSIEMVVGILGILKAGGAYLPIEPEYPEERSKYMLTDSQAKILLTTKNIAKAMNFDKEIIYLDFTLESFHPSIPPSTHSHLPPAPTTAGPSLTSTLTSTCQVSSTNLAYVIYTSGSTGRPKGVIIEHKGIDNLVHFHKDAFKTKDFLRVTQVSSSGFDAMAFEIWPCLLNGSALHIVKDDIRTDPGRLKEWLIAYKITASFQSTAIAVKLLEQEWPETGTALKILWTAGDRLTGYLKHPYPFRLYNLYGPTEDTVWTTWMEVPVNPSIETFPPIGKPISNHRVYILDSYLNLQPIGIAGELCISGIGTARGYLNRPELTAEKFKRAVISHSSLAVSSHSKFSTNDQCPMTNDSSYKLYKTGDLSRWLPDGNIEFLGRIDNQVKIRGFRIELGEIENQLLTHPSIKESIVTSSADETGNRYLCAYIVLNREKPALTELREYLSGRLPNYMIPSYFVFIDNIPLTPNGKIDRNALPKAEPEVGQGRIAPRNPVEERLAELWSGVLGIEKYLIGIDSNFFELGGHSLKATILISKIQSHFNVRVPLTEIFKTPTIQSLAKYININLSDREITREKDDHVVLIRKGLTTANHLFFIHDGSGEVEGYVEFCQAMDANLDFNCWGIKADSLKNHAPQNVTIEEIARKYIKKIKTLQPQGPYFIAGWSIGGTIAFEMVRQLEQRKERIDFLVVIDSPPPRQFSKEKPTIFTIESEKVFIKKYLSDKKIEEKLETITDINKIWPYIIDYLESNHFDVEIIKKVIMEYEAHVVPGYHQLSINELIKYLNIGRTFHQARASYIPGGKIHTPVHYFAASQSRGIIKKHWNDYCKKSIKCYEIKGDHYSVFKMPQVLEFAKIFYQTVNNILKFVREK